MDAIFDRTERLLGSKACKRLQEAHVAVFGLGGVGSYTAEALARSGIGALTLVDHDIVSITNINRQLYALHSTIGQYKTDVAKQRIADINPACRVTAIQAFYTPLKIDIHIYATPLILSAQNLTWLPMPMSKAFPSSVAWEPGTNAARSYCAFQIFITRQPVHWHVSCEGNAEKEKYQT